MLSDEASKENVAINKPFIKTIPLNNSDTKDASSTPEKLDHKTNETKLSQEESKLSEKLNLEDIWKKVIAMLELPSTKMLLSQQAKLINLNSDSAEIAISEKWMNMIQSRKNLIEEAFYKARGSSTKVLLIQQKDNLSNQRKDENTPNQIDQKNKVKVDQDLNKNHLKEQPIESKSDIVTNTIDQKAKQFADFFNGEIVDID